MESTKKYSQCSSDKKRTADNVIMDNYHAKKKQKLQHTETQLEVTPVVDVPINLKETQKLFVGIKVPKHVEQKIYKLLEENFSNFNDERAVWKHGIDFHITLYYIGNENVAEFQEKLGRVESDPFVMKLSKFSHRGNAKLRALTTSNQIHTKLVENVNCNILEKALEEVVGNSKVNRHISLCQLDKDIDDSYVQEFMDQMKDFDLSDITFDVNEIHLYSSTSKPYVILKTIPLTGSSKDSLGDALED